MADEITDMLETEQPADDKVESTDADKESTSELPDDPVLLRAKAESDQQEIARLRRENRQIQRDAKRFQREAEENGAAKEQWYDAYKRASSNPTQAADQAGEHSKPAKQSSATDVKQALAGMPDLADYITEDGNGIVKLIGDLEERGIIVTQARLERMMDERVKKERESVSRTEAEYRRIGELYPDLAPEALDTGSELNKEAVRIYGELRAEKKHLTDSECFELAMNRASRIVKPKGGNSTSNDRLRNAAGGPGSRGGNKDFSPQPTDADIARFRKKLGPGATPEQIKQAAKRSVERTTVWNQEARKISRSA